MGTGTATREPTSSREAVESNPSNSPQSQSAQTTRRRGRRNANGFSFHDEENNNGGTTRWGLGSRSSLHSEYERGVCLYTEVGARLKSNKLFLERNLSYCRADKKAWDENVAQAGEETCYCRLKVELELLPSESHEAGSTVTVLCVLGRPMVSAASHRATAIATLLC